MSEHGEEVRKGQAWYIADHGHPHGWQLYEAIVTRVFGEEVVVAQQGISLQLHAHTLFAEYASSAEEAWQRAEGRMKERLEDLWVAWTAWREKEA